MKLRNHVVLGAVGALMLISSAVAVTGGRAVSIQGTFLQSGPGATLRTIESKLRDETSIKDFGAKCDGSDDSTAINAALAAATHVSMEGSCTATSLVTIPSGRVLSMGVGTFTHAGIRCTDSTTAAVEGCGIRGAGWGKSIIKLGNSLNIDAISNATNPDRLSRKEISTAARASNVVTVTTPVTHNFQTGDVVAVEGTSGSTTSFNGFVTVASTPTGTSFTYAQTAANDTATVKGWVASAFGMLRFSMIDVSVDCNRTNNLTSGDCVRIFSRGINIQNVEITEARGKGLWMEGSTVADFTSASNQLEGSIRNVKIHNTSGIGLLFKGPHDSNFSDVIVYDSVGCAEMWRPFRFVNLNFFLCNSSYGLKLTAQGAAFGTTIQSESVLVDSTNGGAPAPNVIEGAIVYGVGTLPALEIQGYDNYWSGWIKNDVNTAAALKLNGGAGTFVFDVSTVLGNWVDYTATARSQSTITMWSALTPGIAYETGSTATTDVIWFFSAGVLRKAQSQFTSMQVRTGSNGYTEIVDPGGTQSGYMAWRTGAGTRLGYIGNSSTDLAVNLENSANFTVSGGGVSFATGTVATTLSSTAATSRAGFRNANTRNITRNSSVAAVDCAAGALNATVTQLLDGAIFTCATAQTLTLPTWQGASGTVQALPGTPAVGDVLQFTVSSTAAANFTLAGGTGGTVVGNAVTNNTSRVWTCRLTNVGAGTEAASCY